MPIFQVSLTRDSTVVEVAHVDIAAANEKSAKKQALALNFFNLDWRISHTLSSQWPTVENVEILADGDEKLSPRPQE